MKLCKANKLLWVVGFGYNGGQRPVAPCVKKLHEVTKAICEEKIKSFASAFVTLSAVLSVIEGNCSATRHKRVAKRK